MANLDEMKAVLLKADAAGDTQSAQIMADAIAKEQAKEQVRATPRSLPKSNTMMNDFVAGATGSARGFEKLVNKASNVLGGSESDQPSVFRSNRDVDTGSGSYLAGSIMDPVALGSGIAGGGLVNKALNTISNPATRGVISNVTADVLSGAGAGAASGYTSSGGDLGTTGEAALSGGALGPVARVVHKGFSKVHEIAANIAAGDEGTVVNYLNNVFGGDKHKVLDALRKTKALVAGEKPTIAHAAVDPANPIPALVKIEQDARMGGSPAAAKFITRDAENQAARLKPLEEIGAPGIKPPAAQNSPQNLSPAELLRRNATTPLYTAARTDRVKLTPALDEVLSGAEIQGAMGRADKAFSQKVTEDVAKGAKPIPSMVSSRAAKPATTMTTGVGRVKVPAAPAVEGHTSIDHLDKVVKELQTEIAGMAGDTTGQRARLITAKNTIQAEMEKASPKYKQARSEFKTLSEPQNQADVANKLVDALRNSSGNESTTTFLNAIRNEPRTIKTGIGEPRFQELSQVFTPDQMEDVSKVTASALRDKASRGIGVSSKTIPQMENVASQLREVTPPIFGPAWTALRSGLNVGSEHLNAKANAIMHQAALNPDEMARLVGQLPPNERDIVSNYIGKYFMNPNMRNAFVGAATAKDNSGDYNAKK